MVAQPKQGDVYWYTPDPVVGSEISKTRPCVIVSPDEMNKYLNTVVIVPLTSTVNRWPFRVTINYNDRKSSVACDQIRSIDIQRLLKRDGTLDLKVFSEITGMLEKTFTKSK